MAVKDQKVYGNCAEFAKQMITFVNNKDLHDIFFLIGQSRKKVYAHRCILSARCEIFRAMFVENVQKNVPVEKDVPFILTDMDYDTTDVLIAALEYGLNDLTVICEDALVASMDVGNACVRMQASQTYHLEQMTRRVLQYIEENTKMVFESSGFNELSEDTLCTILRSDSLLLDEIDIYHAVHKWADVQSVLVSKSINLVGRNAVKLVRVPLLSMDEIGQLEIDNEKDSFIPMDMFAKAWKVHATKQAEKNNALTRLRLGTAARDSHKLL